MIHEFLKMNPPMLSRSKIDEAIKNFFEEVGIIVYLMHVNEVENVYFYAYQLERFQELGLISRRKI